MADIRYFTGQSLPLEMHKVRVVQKLDLVPIERRLEAIGEAGSNTFLLRNADIFIDMLTDSGVNAMSDNQVAAMMKADDSYAGSETFTRLESKCRDLFGKEYFVPAHQGRACEHILAQLLVGDGDVVPMNYHFTTTKAHITLRGGSIEEIPIQEGLAVESDHPFKGNMDIEALRKVVETKGPEKIAFVRMEAGTNLIGGQPFSLENLNAVRQVCDQFGLRLVLDASLLADNLYFIKAREDRCAQMSIREINAAISDLCDIIYFSARKLGCVRGGGMCIDDHELYLQMRELIPLYEGFLTYGGMSVREMEALTIGLEETMDEDMINQAPHFIAYMVEELKKHQIPVVTPAGGLGCHVDAMQFLDHVPQNQYPAGALASALFLAGGIRGMERGTMSEQRDADGVEPLANMELLRLALPRRVFTVSQVNYVVDRLAWLYENRHIVQGLRFVDEPKNLRFFFGKLEPVSPWQDALAAKFRQDFGDSL